MKKTSSCRSARLPENQYVLGLRHILTVADPLAGKRIDCPPLGRVNRTFMKALKAESDRGEQHEIGVVK